MRNAADEVLAVLVDAIRGGLYESGDLLPRERDLAERLEVSRTVVRSAVDVLRRAGVVSVRRGNNGGIFVRSTANLAHVLADIHGGTRSDLESILEARRPLELATTLLAAERASQQETEQLGELVVALEDLFDRPDEFFETDLRFHLRVAELSGSPLTAELLRETFNRLAVIRAQFPVAHVDHDEALANQRDLLEAIESGERRRILEAVDRHLAAFEAVMLGRRLELLAPSYFG
jgi:GntR family transcriptional repressor for pyruvate dehydrogenase complex